MDEGAWADVAARPGHPSASPAWVEQERILAVDDDPQMLLYLRNTLLEAGYMPVVTGDPDEVERLLESKKPHWSLLDLILPGTDGFELLRRIPRILNVPVIFLFARGMDENITRAFAMGADDYIVKPFSPTELVARIRASLRKRAEPASPVNDEAPESWPEPCVVGNLTIDYPEKRVTVAGRPVRLTQTEYRPLFELSVSPGRVLTHNQLLELLWGQQNPGEPKILRAFVKTFPRKPGDDAKNPSYIFTEPRVGYRLG